MFAAMTGPMLLVMFFIHISRSVLQCEIIIDMSQDDGTVVHISQNSSILVRAVHIKPAVTTLIFELHSEKNLTLSSAKVPMVHNSITGLNVGMAFEVLSNISDAELYIINHNPITVATLVILDSYNVNDVIPGGCNMVFPIEIAPYIKMVENQFSTRIEFQHASIKHPKNISESCSSQINLISYDVFAFYLEEQDYSEAGLFSSIENMKNLSFIHRHAMKAPNYLMLPATTAVFFKYPKTVVIYNVIAKYAYGRTVRESAYVPSASYDCTVFSGSCGSFLYSNKTQALLIILSLFGFFVAIFGHRYFEIELLFFGFTTTIIGSYILLFKYSSYSNENELFYLSLIGGAIGAIFWVLTWSCFYRPVIAVVPVGLGLGLLLMATILFTPLGNNEIFMNKKVYWEFVIGGMLLTTAIFLTVPKILSILGSSIVGSYVAVLIIANYLKSNILFIILNVMKKAIAEEDIAYAINAFPFKHNVIILLWIAVTLLAILFQSIMNWKSYFRVPVFTCLKIKYPSCTCSPQINQVHISSTMVPENRPLLSENRIIYQTF